MIHEYRCVFVHIPKTARLAHLTAHEYTACGHLTKDVEAFDYAFG